MDRFDLEQEIVGCWNILEDIRLMRERFEFDDREDNYLLGLQSIYGERFEELFQTFEELIHKGDCK